MIQSYEAARRLRRFFGLKGQATLDLLDQAVPVVLLENVDRPGYRIEGVRFYSFQTSQLVTASTTWWPFTNRSGRWAEVERLITYREAASAGVKETTVELSPPGVNEGTTDRGFIPERMGASSWAGSYSRDWQVASPLGAYTAAGSEIFRRRSNLAVGAIETQESPFTIVVPPGWTLLVRFDGSLNDRIAISMSGRFTPDET